MPDNNISYDTVLTVVEKTVSSSSFYWQSLSLLACFVASYFFYKFCKKLILNHLPACEKRPRIKRAIEKYLLPLFYQLCATAFLVSGFLIYSQFFKETILFETVMNLMSLFLFLGFLRISSGSSIITNIAGFFLILALVLDTFGALNTTIAFLDQFAINFGKVRISIYLVIKGVTVLLIVFWFSGLVSRKSKHYIGSSKSIDPSTKSILSKIIDITIYAIVIIVLLKVFGVEMTTLALIGGAIGVGVGLGLQKIASNFISGIILLFEKSIKIGDVIELENGIFGTVKNFSGRYTLLEGVDGKEVLIPNEEFIINKVINWTHSNYTARIEINMNLTYTTDVKKVKEIMLACAKAHPRCLRFPEPEFLLSEFGDSSIQILLYFWIGNISDGRQGPKSDVMMSIIQEFHKNNIALPAPQQREVVIKNYNL